MVLDDCRRRKHWSRPLFNTAQYTIAFVAARGTFCLLTGEGFLRPGPFVAEDLAAAIAAGLVFVLVNLLVDISYGLIDPRVRAS